MGAAAFHSGVNRPSTFLGANAFCVPRRAKRVSCGCFGPDVRAQQAGAFSSWKLQLDAPRVCRERRVWRDETAHSGAHKHTRFLRLDRNPWRNQACRLPGWPRGPDWRGGQGSGLCAITVGWCSTKCFSTLWKCHLKTWLAKRTTAGRSLNRCWNLSASSSRALVRTSAAGRARELGLTRTEASQRLAERPWFRQRFAELDMRRLALEANAARFIEWAQADYPVGVEVSMLKMRGSRLIQLWEELSVNALGPEALTLDPAALAPGGPRPARRTASRPRPRHGAFSHAATPLPAVPARSSTIFLPNRYLGYERPHS